MKGLRRPFRGLSGVPTGVPVGDTAVVLTRRVEGGGRRGPPRSPGEWVLDVELHGTEELLEEVFVAG